MITMLECAIPCVKIDHAGGCDWKWWATSHSETEDRRAIDLREYQTQASRKVQSEECHMRGAGFQPAVSAISNRQGARTSATCQRHFPTSELNPVGRDRGCAGGSRTPSQNAILRYSRLETCATGLAAGTVSALKLYWLARRPFFAHHFQSHPIRVAPPQGNTGGLPDGQEKPSSLWKPLFGPTSMECRSPSSIPPGACHPGCSDRLQNWVHPAVPRRCQGTTP